MSRPATTARRWAAPSLWPWWRMVPIAWTSTSLRRWATRPSNAPSPNPCSTIPRECVSMADTLIRQGGATRFTQAVASLAPSAGDRVRLAELTPPGQINLRGRPYDPRFVRTVGAVLGCVLPLSANTVTSAAEVTVLWLGPDEWLLVTNPGEETALVGRLREALGDIHAAVTDVTGNRTRLRLSGPVARETLMKGCSLDLHPRSFRPGQCAQTLLARGGIILHQIDDAPTYDIYPRRSFSEYTWMWLSDAVAEYQR